MKNCILICAGESNPGSLSQFKNKELNNDLIIVCADGGVKACKDAGLIPDVIIGDFDSLNCDPLNLYPSVTYPDIEIIKLPKEKDDTDTMAALRLLVDRGFERVDIYGATGGRFDHYFANVQSLLFAKHHGISAYIHDCYGSQDASDDAVLFVIENESITLSKKAGTIFSMFALGDCAKGVTIKGLKYEIEDATVTNDFPIGVSNEFIGNDAKITVNDGTLLIYIGKEEK